ncbi:MAG: outer membrane beta-barrel protein [Rikenellaceae bacterium]
MKLLKVALAATLILFSTLSTQAEVVSLGLMGGSNITNYNIKGYGTISSKSGYNVGAGVIFKVPVISISPEMIYSSSNFKINNSAIFESKAEVYDRRLDIPVVVGLNIFTPFTVEAGPVFTVYNEAKVSYSGSSSKRSLGRIHPDMGYVLGVKLTLLQKVMIGARLYEHFDYHSFGDSGYNLRSHVYSFSIGYIF